MPSTARRHHILVAAPLHAEPLERLRALFSVEILPALTRTTRIDAASAIVLDQDTPLPAAQQSRLPRLQAIGLTGAGAGQIDLAAMTEAGIRVTHAPLDEPALRGLALWRLLERALNQHALELQARRSPEPHGAPATLHAPPSRFGSRFMQTAVRTNRPITRLRLIGRGAVAAHLRELADSAGYRCLPASEPLSESVSESVSEPAAVERADVAVRVSDDATYPDPGASDEHCIDLRDDYRRQSHPEAIAALRDHLTVDGLIASLGIGRNGFHPRFLLNPEVCPLSCC
jgi:phosphoglycerate dehydrogenase-like enzyme